MMDLNQFGEANVTPAYEYDGDNKTDVEATPVPIHIAHVDLAPMKMGAIGKVGNLAALDPNMRIGGKDIGEIECRRIQNIEVAQLMGHCLSADHQAC